MLAIPYIISSRQRSHEEGPSVEEQAEEYDLEDKRDERQERRVLRWANQIRSRNNSPAAAEVNIHVEGDEEIKNEKHAGDMSITPHLLGREDRWAREAPSTPEKNRPSHDNEQPGLTDSPRMMDEKESPDLSTDLPAISTASPSILNSPASRLSTFPRSITIQDEPARYYPGKIEAGMEDDVTRSPLKRYGTLSSAIDSIMEDWDKRHDPGHPGFWKGVWAVITGDKAAELNDRDDPNYIPPKYRWTPILSGLVIPFSM